MYENAWSVESKLAHQGPLLETTLISDFLLGKLPFASTFSGELKREKN